MTAYQIYEQAVKPLTAEEKLLIARLIMDEVVPEIRPHIEAPNAYLDGMSPQNEPNPPAKVRHPREFRGGRHLLADVDIDALLATPIEDMFEDYMPEDH